MLNKVPQRNVSSVICLRDINPKSKIPNSIEIITLRIVCHLTHLLRCLANNHVIKLGLNQKSMWLTPYIHSLKLKWIADAITLRMNIPINRIILVNERIVVVPVRLYIQCARNPLPSHFLHSCQPKPSHVEHMPVPWQKAHQFPGSGMYQILPVPSHTEHFPEPLQLSQVTVLLPWQVGHVSV